MAPLPVIPGAFYAIVKGSANSSPVSNVFAFRTSYGAMSSTIAASVSGDVATAVATNWHTIAQDLHTSYTASEVHCYPLEYPSLPAFISSFSANGVLTGSVALLQVAALIHHTVYRRGRGSQSRSYLSPLSQDALTADGTQLVAFEHSNIQAHFATFMADTLNALNAGLYGTFDYVQLSRKGAGTTYPVVNSVAELNVASQRGRLPSR